MKRGMVGGAHRGPVEIRRQRRTIRFVQLLLVLTAAGLIAFAGYSFGKLHGFDAGRRADDIDAPARPSVVQTVVLVVLAGIAVGGAALLQDGGTVRIPTPARLEELAGRAEQTAIDKAEEIAGQTEASRT